MRFDGMFKDIIVNVKNVKTIETRGKKING